MQGLGEEKAEELAVVVLHDGAEAGGKGGELQPAHTLYKKKNQWWMRSSRLERLTANVVVATVDPRILRHSGI